MVSEIARLKRFRNLKSRRDKTGNLFFLQQLEELNLYVTATWKLKGIEYSEEPVCFIDIAGSGKGKTALQDLFDSYKYDTHLWLPLGEFTYRDVFPLIYKEYKDGRRVLSTSDLNQIIQRQKSTVIRLFGVMLYVTEKRGLRHVKGPEGELCKLNPPIQMSWIAGITPSVYSQNFMSWFDWGLQDRLIPRSWNTTQEQQREIAKFKQLKLSIPYTKRREEFNPFKIELPEKDVVIPVAVSDILYEPAEKLTDELWQRYQELKARKMERLELPKKVIEGWIEKQRTETYAKPAPTRFFGKLISLTRGRTLCDGRRVATKDDAERIKYLAEKHMNLKFKLLSEGEP